MSKETDKIVDAYQLGSQDAKAKNLILILILRIEIDSNIRLIRMDTTTTIGGIIYELR